MATPQEEKARYDNTKDLVEVVGETALPVSGIGMQARKKALREGRVRRVRSRDELAARAGGDVAEQIRANRDTVNPVTLAELDVEKADEELAKATEVVDSYTAKLDQATQRKAVATDAKVAADAALQKAREDAAAEKQRQAAAAAAKQAADEKARTDAEAERKRQAEDLMG